MGQPRRDFALGCHNRSPTEAELVVFGGMKRFLWCLVGETELGNTTLLYLGTFLYMKHHVRNTKLYVAIYISKITVVLMTHTITSTGVKSLYHSCVDYVAERYELYQSLLQQLLPAHIQTDISRERDKRANRAHYRVALL